MQTDSTMYVYVAAPMSGNPSEYLANVARMNAYSRHLIDTGHCPINPASDMAEGLASTTPMSDSAYKIRSMNLLRLLFGREDAVMHVLATEHRDGRKSTGVAAEMQEAGSFGLPIEYVTGW